MLATSREQRERRFVSKKYFCAQRNALRTEHTILTQIGSEQ